MKVSETFFTISVRDMDRAVAFYAGVFGASEKFTSPIFSSLIIAGVRVGLFHHPPHPGGRIGLHFVVDALDAAAIERAGGKVVAARVEVAPGVFTSDVVDSEGNEFSLRLA